MYGKIENNKLIYAPKTLRTEDNRLIVNFKTNESIMKEYGYKEVINEIPDYDPQTQYISVLEYQETDDKIIVVCEVRDNPIDEFTKILLEEVNNYE